MNIPAVSSLSSVSLHGFLVAKAYFSVYVRFTTNLGLLYDSSLKAAQVTLASPSATEYGCHGLEPRFTTPSG